MLTRNRKAARKSLRLPRAAVWFLSQCRPEIYPYTTYMRFFVPRLLLRNTATGFAYGPIGQYGYGLRLLPYRAIRLRCYAIAPCGAIRSAVRLFACGKYASQIYTLRSYSKKHQYIAISNSNVRIFRFIPIK